MTLEDYEDALKSFIHDDDKLVTYKWLSKEFEIHVNVAKDILKQYWKKHKDSEKIVATYLLVGQLKDRSIRVEVVKETNLNVAKDKFIKVDCEHLYSLQKCLHDIELLTFAGEGDLRYSAIKCNEEYVRSDDEIDGLRYIGNIKKEEIKSTISSNKVLEKQLPKTSSNKVSEKQLPKTSSNKVSEKQLPKTSSNNFSEKQLSKETEFSKEKTQSVKTVNDSIKGKDKVEEKEKSESKSESKTINVEKKVSPTNKSNNSKSTNKVTKKPIQSKQSGFNNLFGKVPNKPQESNKLKNEVDSVEKQKPSINTVKKEDIKESKEKIDNVKEQQKEPDTPGKEKENQNFQTEKKSKNVSKSTTNVDTKTKSKNKKDTRGKKRNRSEEKNSSSKRKRIVVMDSSEDEEDKSNDDDNDEEEPMEVEPEPPKISRKRSPPPPAEKCENGKRMIRKTVDKTFKDEDGYLVTKSVHVYEAASDSEEPAEVKKEESKKPKPVENKARKQTSLMSFFKKS